MAYSTTQHEINLTSGTAVIDATSTGDKARWNPGTKKTRIRRLSFVSNATPGDAGVLKFDLRPTFGSDSGRGDGDVGVLNIATSHTAGKVVYKDVNVSVSPGQEVVAEVTDASASLNGIKVQMLVEYDEEQPANITAFVAST